MGILITFLEITTALRLKLRAIFLHDMFQEGIKRLISGEFLSLSQENKHHNSFS